MKAHVMSLANNLKADCGHYCSCWLLTPGTAERSMKVRHPDCSLHRKLFSCHTCRRAARITSEARRLASQREDRLMRYLGNRRG